MVYAFPEADLYTNIVPESPGTLAQLRTVEIFSLGERVSKILRNFQNDENSRTSIPQIGQTLASLQGDRRSDVENGALEVE